MSVQCSGHRAKRSGLTEVAAREFGVQSSWLLSLRSVLVRFTPFWSVGVGTDPPRQLGSYGKGMDAALVEPLNG